MVAFFVFWRIMNGLLGRKTSQTQGFLQDGTRVPLTVVSAMGNMVTQIKTSEKEGYDSIQLGFDIKKHANRASLGHSKKAGLEKSPRFFAEIKAKEGTQMQLGSVVQPSEVFKPGDIVDVIGVSKGKGFAGVVKRHHFKGGPRTHGQSDRERAPGSIGQTTTPGHVYRGKRMAGRLGHEKATVKNLEVIEIANDGAILIKGLVPGFVGSVVVVTKVGENKKFVPLYKEEVQVEEKAAEVQPEAQIAEENVQAAAEEVKTPEEVKTVEEKKEEVKENAS